VIRYFGQWKRRVGGVEVLVEDGWKEALQEFNDFVGVGNGSPAKQVFRVADLLNHFRAAKKEKVAESKYFFWTLREDAIEGAKKSGA
jgi:hypothetical protein